MQPATKRYRTALTRLWDALEDARHAAQEYRKTLPSGARNADIGELVTDLESLRNYINSEITKA